jgi:hypothetical protein
VVQKPTTEILESVVAFSESMMISLFVTVTVESATQSECQFTTAAVMC